MLALAFRVTPQRQRTFPPSIGGAVVIPPLEALHAVQVATKANMIWDIDRALEDAEVQAMAIQQTVELLSASNYDIEEWKVWLAQHPKRPLKL
jgi:hypothetical protein